MNTLISSPVAPLVDRLFAEAAGSEAALHAMAAELPPGELERLMRSRTEYVRLYGHLKDMPLPVTPATGKLLYMLARSCHARTIVEFGTSFGISTLHLAAALRDNGGGRLITSEFEPSKVARAQAHLAAAGLDDLVEFRAGDALQTLATGLPERIDLVLLDGAKALYADILSLLEARMPPGAWVLADNADHCPEYVARMRAPESGWMSTSCGAELELSLRQGDLGSSGLRDLASEG